MVFRRPSGFWQIGTKNLMLVTREQIRAFQIDHNSTCNLRCPQCARSHIGATESSLPQTELPVDFYQRLFTPQLCRQLESVLFCGNYGDVIASKNILAVLTHLREAGLRKISIFTNGSLRTTDWWRDLAQILAGQTGRVCFSIDGLADTNAIYRVGSSFAKIMDNAAAFIAAGGRAQWDFLVFQHNEHQVESAMELARTMGFHSFKIKKTNRFIKNPNYQSGVGNQTDPVHLKDQTYSIAAPTTERYRAQGVGHFEEIVQRYGGWEGYIDQTAIQCKAQSTGSLFLDFTGRLWPCTWLAAPIYFHDRDNIQRRQVLALLAKYGEDFNDLSRYDLDRVLAHPWFAAELEQSWGLRMKDCANAKLMTCGRTCGTEYRYSSNDQPNTEIFSLR